MRFVKKFRDEKLGNENFVYLFVDLFLKKMCEIWIPCEFLVTGDFTVVKIRLLKELWDHLLSGAMVTTGIHCTNTSYSIDMKYI